MHGRRTGVATLLLSLMVLIALLSAFWWPDTDNATANGPRLPWGLAEKRLALRLADDVLLASQALASERGLALAALSALEPIGPPRPAPSPSGAEVPMGPLPGSKCFSNTCSQARWRGTWNGSPPPRRWSYRNAKSSIGTRASPQS